MPRRIPLHLGDLTLTLIVAVHISVITPGIRNNYNIDISIKKFKSLSFCYLFSVQPVRTAKKAPPGPHGTWKLLLF